MKATISGELVKIAFADQVDILLQHDSPNRPAARFNRKGQNALYLSVDEQSARVAMKKYAADSDAPRVLIRYNIDSCELVDLRHPDADSLRQRASLDWKATLQNGGEPDSWLVADELRERGEIGLIDPSRKNPGLWHVTLLQWNKPGAPTVTVIDEPSAIYL